MAVFGLPAPLAIFEPPPAQVARRHERLGQWRLTVWRDRFTGQVSCELAARGMTVARAAITFRFGARVTTYQALYRLDSGPVVSWRVNAMALADRGALPNDESLANPSGGLVAVPLAAVRGAQAITVRPSLASQPRRYRLSDLPAALRGAEAAGCGADFAAESAR